MTLYMTLTDKVSFLTFSFDCHTFYAFLAGDKVTVAVRPCVLPSVRPSVPHFCPEYISKII